ncbi:MAG: NAD-dependent epimerase/dehydratase family protein [Bacteroidales bacterium]
MQSGYNILLTGGAGFLGTAILDELFAASSPLPVNEVRVLDLKPVTKIENERITFIKGDVTDQNVVLNACNGVDLVIHSAAIVDWGTKSEKEIMSVNYEGTLHVIEACKARQVKALVFTSSLDVLYDGNPLVNVNEETPYPERHSTSYCESKYLAEKKVLEANGATLGTCSIRPSDIFGEGDPYHIGSLIKMARGGFYVRLGNGKSLCQHVYVGNVAYAHILASAELLNGNSPVNGQAYFITDGPPTNFFKFFDSFVEGIGYTIWPKNLWLPRRIAFTLGSISEAIAYLMRPIRKYSPKMSRFAVTYTCTDYTFSSGKARDDFGFVAKYSPQVAFDRTIDYFRNVN